MHANETWDIFCTVVDNFGDAGVCWRLARQLVAEHGFNVRLWLDNLAVLRKIEPVIDPQRDAQICRGVEVRLWTDSFPEIAPADVVVEAFACELPARYVEAMAQCSRKPCWINLEYLSAESWVREHHGLPSPHPRLPLTKYFFFPGFDPGTGGLLRERGLFDARRAFCADARAQAELWRSLGFPSPRAGELRINLFTYDNPMIGQLLAAWSGGGVPVSCLVPEGPAVPRVAEFFGRDGAAAGESFERGNLTVHVLPFVEQERYDRLLWACDFLFVRGEDSFVRAQWAARPFVWHIYPQSEDAHLPKLRAFLDLYCADLAEPAVTAVRDLWLAWNGPAGGAAAWAAFLTHRDLIAAHSEHWADTLAARTDLAANLVDFCRNRLK